MMMPPDIGPFHIVGIGGIGMSAIADILLSRGYTVQGSDMNDSANVRRLRARGIRVFVGHDAVNLVGAKFLVVSTAIKKDNPELLAAIERGIPVIRRADMLCELMRDRKTVSVTGTHGKTTTTSLVAHIFERAGLDPTVLIGGIINEWASNARAGLGDWMIVEADESDGTFKRLPTQIGIVTNADAEHLDYYGSLEAMEEAFRQFFRQIPFYGLTVACIDHPVLRRLLAETASERSSICLSYGFAHDADLRLSNLRNEGIATVFDLAIAARVPGGARLLQGLKLPIPGQHNALNAVAALAVAIEAGVSDAVLRSALQSFSGVKRRFTPAGNWNGVDIFDDYAHHPVEIAAVLKAARPAARGRVIAVAQPHRYSRLNDLMDDFARCFADADIIAILPVYAAGEAPIAGVDHIALVERIRAAGQTQVIALDSEHEIAPLLHQVARPGDIIIGMGAGSISEWTHSLAGWLSSVKVRVGEVG